MSRLGRSNSALYDGLCKAAPLLAAVVLLLAGCLLNPASGQGLSNPNVALGSSETAVGCAFNDFEDLVDLLSDTIGRGGGRRGSGRGSDVDCLQASLEDGQVNKTRPSTNEMLGL
jgi:hypothetical protein